MRLRRGIAFVLSLLLALGITVPQEGCSSSQDDVLAGTDGGGSGANVVSQNVSAQAGGTLTIPGGVTLTIPPGALAKDTVVSVATPASQTSASKIQSFALQP